ncbi:MAG: TrkH family potassium uptake protein [Christensenellales bacterium]
MDKIKKGLRKVQPVQIIALGFLVMILLGGALLTLPVASANGNSLGFINGLFTSTSAVCVTGLIAVDTGIDFSVFGQIVIILLIQAGGLGFMTVTTMIFLLMRKRISLRERIIIRESLNEESLSGMVKMIKRILLVTFISELIGAISLSIRFIPLYGAAKGIYFSFFHAVSAFCNAGFDLIGGFRSLTPFANDFLINVTIMALIVVGGIGFVVILDIARKIKMGKAARLALHSKIALIVTIGLIVFGAVAFYILENGNQNTIGSPALTPGGKALAAAFQSVTPRTAGFNTIDQNSLGSAAKLLTMILMFIGASPAGTGGGIKTSTAAVIVLLVSSIVRGKRDVNVLGKRIDTNVILRAIAIVMLAILLVLTVSLLLFITEKSDGVFTFENIMFEVFSAFGTVGLSTGISPLLSVLGKILIMLTMYGGRVGMLTLMLAVANRLNRDDSKIRYPEEKIIVG